MSIANKKQTLKIHRISMPPHKAPLTLMLLVDLLKDKHFPAILHTAVPRTFVSLVHGSQHPITVLLSIGRV